MLCVRDSATQALCHHVCADGGTLLIQRTNEGGKLPRLEHSSLAAAPPRMGITCMCLSCRQPGVEGLRLAIAC